MAFRTSSVVTPNVAACPDENTMMRSAEGTLDPGARASLRRHLLGCTLCKQIVAELRTLSRAPRGARRLR
jgi:anti-sigma factor RsiW